MAEERTMPPVWSVSSLTAAIKSRLEGDFRTVDLEAEISGWRIYPSGHAYFTLKDEGAQISAVMFASDLVRCENRDGFGNGSKVKARGSVTVYPPRGNYQVVVRRMRLVGDGELMRRYVELKAKLEAEGLFDSGRKRPLPLLPRRIGIVTSEAGAVIHDMCTVLTRRFPNLEIRLCPAVVQGAEAPEALIAGVKYFQSADWAADLLIVARGGGSFEDLYCFNDEALVRAVAASRIPVISAVGHETDFTLCDFAADIRAGTPSIAAEIAVPMQAELREAVAGLERRMRGALRATGEYFAQRLDHCQVRLHSALRTRGESCARRLDVASASLLSAVKLCREKAERRFECARTGLKLLSPYSILERGYSLTTDAEGAVVKDAGQVKPGDELVTRLARGSVRSNVTAGEVR